MTTSTADPVQRAERIKPRRPDSNQLGHVSRRWRILTFACARLDDDLVILPVGLTARERESRIAA
jgi:hypothetical protein